MFLTRNPERLRTEGFSAVGAGDLPAACDSPASLILDTVPTYRRDGKLQLPYRSALSALMEGRTRPVYLHLSTTAVYPSGFTAQRDGDLPTQNEDTIPHPESGRAKDRLLLEEAIIDTYAGARILRTETWPHALARATSPALRPAIGWSRAYTSTTCAGSYSRSAGFSQG